MVPTRPTGKLGALQATKPSVPIDSDGIPTKSQILEDIQEGYLFVKSGGKEQPVDEIHREIAELPKDVDRRLASD